MSFLSHRAQQVNPSPTLGLTARFQQLKREGKDVVGFLAGEPDFDTPENIKESAIAALKKGATKYTPTTGIPELKEAICKKLLEDNGIRYTPQEVIVSCGAKHSLYNAFMALLNPGDEVLIPSPYWVTYPEQVKLAEGVPVFVPTEETNHFRLTAEAVKERITPRTKILLLNSPCNPTGAMVTFKELTALAEIALRHNLLIISDEIYEKLVYGEEKPTSIASLGEEVKARTITINGVSKAYSMTGWRIGYAAGPAEVISAMGRIQDQSTSNPTAIAQWAAVEALQGPQEAVEQMRQEFARRRQLIVEGLNSIPGIHCLEPDGAFYVFPRVSDLYRGEINSSDALAEFWLQEAGVLVIPGSGFGADAYVRLSYATSRETITKGLERIRQGVDCLLSR